MSRVNGNASGVTSVSFQQERLEGAVRKQQEESVFSIAASCDDLRKLFDNGSRPLSVIGRTPPFECDPCEEYPCGHRCGPRHCFPEPYEPKPKPRPCPPWVKDCQKE